MFSYLTPVGNTLIEKKMFVARTDLMQAFPTTDSTGESSDNSSDIPSASKKLLYLNAKENVMKLHTKYFSK